MEKNWPIADRLIPETIAGHTSSFIVSGVANGNTKMVLFRPLFQLWMLPYLTVSLIYLPVHFQ